MFESCFFDTEWLKLGVISLTFSLKRSHFKHYSVLIRISSYFSFYLMCVLVIHKTLQCAAMSQSVPLFFCCCFIVSIRTGSGKMTENAALRQIIVPPRIDVNHPTSGSSHWRCAPRAPPLLPSSTLSSSAALLPWQSRHVQSCRRATPSESHQNNLPCWGNSTPYLLARAPAT